MSSEFKTLCESCEIKLRTDFDEDESSASVNFTAFTLGEVPIKVDTRMKLIFIGPPLSPTKLYCPGSVPQKKRLDGRWAITSGGDAEGIDDKWQDGRFSRLQFHNVSTCTSGIFFNNIGSLNNIKVDVSARKANAQF